MSLIPDILRLLPSWFTVTELVRAKRVCKLWYNSLAWPEKVWILTEWWNDGDQSESMITLFIGQCTTVPKPSLLRPHLSLQYEWYHDYHRQWLHLPFAPIAIVKQCCSQYTLLATPKIQYQLGSFTTNRQPVELSTEEIDSHFALQLIADVSLKPEDEYDCLALDRECNWLFIHYDQWRGYEVQTGEPYYYLYLRGLPIIWEKEILDWDDGCPQGFHILKRTIKVLADSIPEMVKPCLTSE